MGLSSFINDGTLWFMYATLYDNDFTLLPFSSLLMHLITLFLLLHTIPSSLVHSIAKLTAQIITEYK